MFEKIYEVKDANAEEVTSGDDVKFEGDGYAEDKTKIVEAQTLKDLDGSDDEFLDFLINLPNYPERHNFSESLVEKILRRSFVLMTLEEGGIEDVDQKVLFKVIEALEVHLDFTRTEEFSGESLKDKAFKIFLEMYKELPPLVQDSFFDQLMQNPQTLRKDILLSGIKLCGEYNLRHIFIQGLNLILDDESAGRKFARSLVGISKKIPEEQQGVLFEKCGLIIDSIFAVDNLVRESGLDEKFSGLAKSYLIGRAGDILERAVEVAKGGSVDVDNLISQLQSIQIDNQVLVSVFRSVAREGHVDSSEILNNFKDLNFSEERVIDLKWDDLYRLNEIYKINYQSTPKFQERLIKNFEEILKNKEQKIYVVRHRGAIVGFYLYTSNEDESLDFRCFNMDPAYTGGGIGKKLMEEELKQRAKENVIHATCTAELPISSEYIESGFVATGYGHTDEINYLEITRNDKRANLFESKSWEIDKVSGFLSDGTQFEDGSKLVVSERDVSRLPFKRAGEKEGDKVLVLTRYIRSRQKQGNTILVFEKVPESKILEYDKMTEVNDEGIAMTA